MSNDFRSRIQRRLEELGVSPRAVSLAAGMGPDVIRDLMRKPESSPTLETLRKLATALNTTPEYLAYGMSEIGALTARSTNSIVFEHDRADINTKLLMHVARPGGYVRTGIYYNTGHNVEFIQTAFLYPSDPMYPELPYVFFDAQGDGMDKLHPRPILNFDQVIAFPYTDFVKNNCLKSSMILVVDRIINNGSLTERSLRELQITENGYVLHARSSVNSYEPILTDHSFVTTDEAKIEALGIVRYVNNMLKWI